MQKQIIRDLLFHIRHYGTRPVWPFSFGSPASIAAAISIACRVNENGFSRLMEGKISHGGTVSEILKEQPDLTDQDLKAFFLSWARSSPVHQGSRIKIDQEHLFSLRHNLQKTFTSFEVIDTIMLLGFGEKVFPVSHFLKNLFIQYHLFDDSHSYENIRTLLESNLTNMTEIIETFLCSKKIDLLNDNRKALITENIRNKVRLSCSNCGTDLNNIRNPIVADIKIYPSKNTIITKEDMEKDFRREWEKILKETENLSEKDMEKQVMQNFRLFLCNACRKSFIHRIENGEIV